MCHDSNHSSEDWLSSVLSDESVNPPPPAMSQPAMPVVSEQAAPVLVAPTQPQPAQTPVAEPVAAAKPARPSLFDATEAVFLLPGDTQNKTQDALHTANRTEFFRKLKSVCGVKVRSVAAMLARPAFKQRAYSAAMTALIFCGGAYGGAKFFVPAQEQPVVTPAKPSNVVAPAVVAEKKPEPLPNFNGHLSPSPWSNTGSVTPEKKDVGFKTGDTENERLQAALREVKASLYKEQFGGLKP